MSDQRILDWAWRQITIGPEWKLALVVLAFHAESDGRGRISLEQLGRDTSIDEPKLPAILEALEIGGFAYVNITDGMVSFRLNLAKQGRQRT